MNMRAPGHTPKVDRGIGDAFPIVEEVYRHLEQLKYLAENSEKFVSAQIEFKADPDLESILWKYEKDDEWKVLVTYAELTGVDLSSLEEDLNQIIDNSTSRIKDSLKEELNTFEGVIPSSPSWSDVPAHSDPAFDVQAQALANRTNLLYANAYKPRPEIDVTKFGAVPDCTGVGLGTDNSAAFSVAIEYWKDQGDFARLVVPSGRYRIASNLVAELNKLRGMEFIMLGSITPDANVSRAISFINGRDLVTRLKVCRGGSLADYTQADPVGGTEAFYFRGIRGNDMEVEADTYLGRVVRITRQQEGEEKTSKLILRKLFTGDLGSGSGRCGQSIYCDDAGIGDSQGAFGGVLLARTYWDYYGPVFEDLSDVLMGDWEGAFRNTGIEVYGCQVVMFDRIYLGDTGYSGGSEVPVLKLRNSRTLSNRFWNRINVNQLRVLKTAIGLDAEGNGSLDVMPSVWVGCLEARGTFGGSEVKTVARLHNVRRADLNIRAYECGCAVEMTGSDTLDNKIKIIGRQFNDTPIKIGNLSANGSNHFEGFVRDLTVDKPVVKVDGTSAIEFNAMSLASARDSYVIDAPPNNNVKLIGGRVAVSGSAVAFSNRPRLVTGVTGVVSVSSGTATITAGTDRVTVTHGLFSTPTSTPVLTPRSAGASGAFVPGGITATTFQIVLPAVAASDVLIGWRAEA